MSADLEKRVSELEAQIRALISLMLSDIGSTQTDGTRDITAMLNIAESEMAAAARSSIPKAALIIDDLLGGIRAVLELPAPLHD